MSKALLIKSYTTLTTGTQGNWNDLTMASSYIQGIQTGKILEDVTADKIAALISGVPTTIQVCTGNIIKSRSRHIKFWFDTVL